MNTEAIVVADVLQKLKLFFITEIKCTKYDNFTVCMGSLDEDSVLKKYNNLNEGQCIELEPICQRGNNKLFVVELKICKNYVYVISPYYFVAKVIEVNNKLK